MSERATKISLNTLHFRIPCFAVYCFSLDISKGIKYLCDKCTRFIVQLTKCPLRILQPDILILNRNADINLLFFSCVGYSS